LITKGLFDLEHHGNRVGTRTSLNSAADRTEHLLAFHHALLNAPQGRLQSIRVELGAASFRIGESTRSISATAFRRGLAS
jgi:hypothetical protein